jgi:sucrose synthase
VTRLIPEAQGTRCNQRIEKVLNTQYSQILRVPFKTEKGVLRRWVSRFDVWPYLEKFAEAIIVPIIDFFPDFRFLYVNLHTTLYMENSETQTFPDY